MAPPPRLRRPGLRRDELQGPEAEERWRRHRRDGGTGSQPCCCWALPCCSAPPSFGNPVIGSDEGDEQFYLLVGDRMLHGLLPYVDVWDRKPVGLFLVYAAIRLLGGEGIWQYQLAATAVRRRNRLRGEQDRRPLRAALGRGPGGRHLPGVAGRLRRRGRPVPRLLQPARRPGGAAGAARRGRGRVRAEAPGARRRRNAGHGIGHPDQVRRAVRGRLPRLRPAVAGPALGPRHRPPGAVRALLDRLRPAADGGGAGQLRHHRRGPGVHLRELHLHFPARHRRRGLLIAGGWR